MNRPILTHEAVLSMKNYIQHSNVNCFEHSVYVAFLSFTIASWLNRWIRMDVKAIVNGAMLHDFFLYDWHKPREKKEIFFEKHGFTHPDIAHRNALRYFSLSERETDIILKHMWPLRPQLPKYRESVLVMLVDKYCSLREIVYPYGNKHLKKQIEYLHVLIEKTNSP